MHAVLVLKNPEIVTIHFPHPNLSNLTLFFVLYSESKAFIYKIFTLPEYETIKVIYLAKSSFILSFTCKRLFSEYKKYCIFTQIRHS